MTKQTYRKIQHVLLLVTVFVLGSTLYFEYGKGLQPCPLCLMQRFCIFLFGFSCLVALCTNNTLRARRITLFQIGILIAGVYFAGRQIWLQSLPVDHTAACMPSLDMLVRYFSKTQLLSALFWGTGDCGEVNWRFLGLSMPMWSELYFIGAFVITSYVFWGLNRLIRLKSSS